MSGSCCPRVLVDEVAVAANLDAECRTVQLTVERVNPALAVIGDPQLLASAVMNLLQNAFKFTPAKGRVTLRARAENGHILIEIEDECGGLERAPEDLFRPFGERRERDRSGLGLGLAISRKAVQASGGEVQRARYSWQGLRLHHRPAVGCPDRIVGRHPGWVGRGCNKRLSPLIATLYR